MTDVSRPDWLEWPQVRQVMDIFAAAGVPLCFVGGCLRDAFIGKPPADFDILVASPIEETKRILKEAGIVSEQPEMAIKIERAQVGGHQFDFLHSRPENVSRSFRKTTERYVRRNDFTINALCLFATGELYDPCGGLADLRAGKVRFLEEAKLLISYYPRPIIRFFRFFAWHGKGDPDAESLALCATHAEKILSLSRWIVQAEMRKFLPAPRCFSGLDLMHRYDALKYALGFSIVDLSLIQAMEHVESAVGRSASWQLKVVLLLLSATLPPEQALAHLADFWALEKHVKKDLAVLLDYVATIDVAMPMEVRENLCAQLGGEMAVNLLLLRWALEDDVEAAKEKYLAAIAAIK